MYTSKLNFWYMNEASKLLTKVNNIYPQKGYILLETGYSPSGLPHIGIYSEIIRTNIIRICLLLISNLYTKVICVSDDMDSLRKIPCMYNSFYFSKYIFFRINFFPSYSITNFNYSNYINDKFINLFNKFYFCYDFVNINKLYRCGRLNKFLKLVLFNYRKIMKIIIPTLTFSVRKKYNIFLPVCCSSFRVLQVNSLNINFFFNIISYFTTCGRSFNVSVLDGKCKLQWKIEFPLRWIFLDVDYELYGKDIFSNSHIYKKVFFLLKKDIPQQTFYELFLDNYNKKISKSRNNTFFFKTWLKLINFFILNFFIYKFPKRALRLKFSLVPIIFNDYFYYLSNVYNFFTSYNIKYNFFFFSFFINKNLFLNFNFSSILFVYRISTLVDKLLILFCCEKILLFINCKIYIRWLNFSSSHVFNYYKNVNIRLRFFLFLNHENFLFLKFLKRSISVQSLMKELIFFNYNFPKFYYFSYKFYFQLIYNIFFGSDNGIKFFNFLVIYDKKRVINLINDKISY